MNPKPLMCECGDPEDYHTTEGFCAACICDEFRPVEVPNANK